MLRHGLNGASHLLQRPQPRRPLEGDAAGDRRHRAGHRRARSCSSRWPTASASRSASTGSPDNAIVTQRGVDVGAHAPAFAQRQREHDVVDSRVKRDANGRPLASPEIVIVANLPRITAPNQRHACAASRRWRSRCGRTSRSSPDGTSARPLRDHRRAEGSAIATRPGSRRQHQAAAARLEIVGVFTSGGQRLRERDLGRRRRHGAGLQPRRRLPVADAAPARPSQIDAFKPSSKPTRNCRCQMRRNGRSTRARPGRSARR